MELKSLVKRSLRYICSTRGVLWLKLKLALFMMLNIFDTNKSEFGPEEHPKSATFQQLSEVMFDINTFTLSSSTGFTMLATFLYTKFNLGH